MLHRQGCAEAQCTVAGTTRAWDKTKRSSDCSWEYGDGIMVEVVSLGSLICLFYPNYNNVQPILVWLRRKYVLLCVSTNSHAGLFAFISVFLSLYSIASLSRCSSSSSHRYCCRQNVLLIMKKLQGPCTIVSEYIRNQQPSSTSFCLHYVRRYGWFQGWFSYLFWADMLVNFNSKRLVMFCLTCRMSGLSAVQQLALYWLCRKNYLLGENYDTTYRILFSDANYAVGLS